MPTSHPSRAIGALLVVMTIAGCSSLLPNVDPGPLPGGRRWIIAVNNQSAQPTSLLVAVDGAPGPATNIGPTVGRATPSTVPPHGVMEVTFDVPAGGGWAIFVNPDPHGGPLILASDIPANAVGKLPITIHVDVNGQIYWGQP